MAPPEISVVIPLYNEGGHLAGSLQRIARSLREATESWEFVLIDDGSRDETWAVVSRLKEHYPLRAIRFSRNFGKEAALAAGLETAEGQAVITMDGDLQHPPKLLPKMIQVWRSGAYDIVEATKRERGEESAANRLGANGFYWLMHRLTGFDLRGASDFKLLDRRVVESWDQLEERTLFFRGVTAWLGFRVKKLEFSVAARAGGQSGWSKLRLVVYAVNSISAFTSAPLMIVNLLGVAFLLLAGALTLQSLRLYFEGRAVDGFTTVILMQCIIGSFLMFSLGVIGHYLGRVFDEVKRRPRYIASERIDR